MYFIFANTFSSLKKDKTHQSFGHIMDNNIREVTPANPTVNQN